jgi:hypothetical protein
MLVLLVVSQFQASTSFCWKKNASNTAPHINHEIDQSNSSRQSGLWAIWYGLLEGNPQV